AGAGRRPPLVICFFNLSSGAIARNGVGPGTAMNQWLTEPNGGPASRNWRLGIGLALVAVLYIAAVIAFIIVY
ncbi:MAG TPA: hypothetical protein VKH62_00595, partial [Candidatus Binatia bacterium]|nr:hypothetical protein [Candidatus Binatia bacterium]